MNTHIEQPPNTSSFPAPEQVSTGSAGLSSVPRVSDLSKSTRRIRQRQKITREVFTRFQQVKELTDGYAFRYPHSATWAAKLEEFTQYWQSGYPFFTTALDCEPNAGGIWLHIRGPEGAKGYIQNLLDAPKPPAFMKKGIGLGFRILTSPIRVLPDFIIIGAAKCGTTALYFYLTQHPGVAPAFKKEVYFFDRRFGRGMVRYQAYFPTFLEKYYAKQIRKQDLATGESTPCYLFHPHVPRRVFETIPGVKLIVLLRNPVDRAYSHYHMKLRSRHETLSFKEAIEREEERLRGELEKMLADENYFSFKRQHYSYLARGVYVEQLQNWMNFFPKEQMLILTTEAFYKDLSTTFQRVLAFLNLPGWEPQVYRTYNAIPYPKMDASLRKRLIAYFEPHNHRLYEFLGLDLGWDR